MDIVTASGAGQVSPPEPPSADRLLPVVIAFYSPKHNTTEAWDSSSHLTMGHLRGVTALLRGTRQPLLPHPLSLSAILIFTSPEYSLEYFQ